MDLSYTSSRLSLGMDQARPRAATDPLNLSTPTLLSPSRPTSPSRGSHIRPRAHTDPIPVRPRSMDAFSLRDVPPLQLTGVSSDGFGLMTTRSSRWGSTWGTSPRRPLTAPETCESPEERVERNERKPIFCPTTSNSAALTASYYRKRQPAKVETRLCTRYMLTSDYPLRPQHSGYSLAEDMYEDEKRTSGREIPIHLRPSLRKHALGEKGLDRPPLPGLLPRARSASGSPKKSLSKQASVEAIRQRESPTASKQELSRTKTLEMARVGTALTEHAVLDRNMEGAKLGDRPLGDCIWMAWKLGNAA